MMGAVVTKGSHTCQPTFKSLECRAIKIQRYIKRGIWFVLVRILVCFHWAQICRQTEIATNKKVPPWYAVLAGSVVDSDGAKIGIISE